MAATTPCGCGASGAETRRSVGKRDRSPRSSSERWPADAPPPKRGPREGGAATTFRSVVHNRAPMGDGRRRDGACRLRGEGEELPLPGVPAGDQTWRAAPRDRHGPRRRGPTALAYPLLAPRAAPPRLDHLRSERLDSTPGSKSHGCKFPKDPSIL